MTTETAAPSRRFAKPTRFAPWFVAVPLDFVCIVAFVLGGKDSHNIKEGATWLFEVIFPLTVGFFAAALATQLYRKADNRWVRLLVAIIAGVVLWGAIRFVFFDRLFLSVSNLVAAAFLLVTMGGWRLVAIGITKARARS
jgi:hypothetical protein